MNSGLSNSATANRDSSITGRWLGACIGILGILLVFFAGLSAQENAQAVPPPEPVAPRVGIQEVMTRLEKTGLDLTLEQRGLVITLPQSALFAPGADTLNPAAIASLKQIALALKQVSNPVNLVYDMDPTRSADQRFPNQRFDDTWELAAARGLRLLETMVNDFGIAQERFSVTSHVLNSGRLQRGRVEIVVLDQEAR